MTFVVDGTNGLTFNDATTQSSTATNASNISSGTLGKARLPTGSVLQVVNATYATNTTTTGTTFIDTGLSASITPTSSSSKILVSVTHPIAKYGGSTAGPYMSLKLLRNSTDLSTFEKQTLYTGTTVEINGTTSTFYLDSPATTSSTTYKTQYKNVVANGTVAINPDSSVSTMTLMEIAA